MPLGRPLYEPTRDTRIADHEYWIQRLLRRTTDIGAPTPGVAAEVLFLDTTLSGGVTSTTVLEDGVKYGLTVQGTYSLWNHVIEVGTPESDAMFPGATGGRVSTEVGLDAESEFAGHDTGSGVTLGHTSLFQIDLGSGYAHIEPDDGSHAEPASGHLYSYTVTGQGSTASFKIQDINYADNYGELKIVIQSLEATTGGGDGSGTGTLLPSPDSDNEILSVSGGIAAWATSVDGGSA